MSNDNVADLIVETLHQAGIRRIFGVVGDSLNGLTEALRERGTIDWVHVRHEEVAAFAAAGESQITGKLAVCAGSCGPSNLHLINGLYDAQRTRTPVLAIAAQIPSAEIGGGYFQETHPQNLFRECSVYCELVSDPHQLPFVLENAIRAAVGERGVSVVVIPGDVALMEAPKRGISPVGGLLPAAPVVTPAENQLNALAELLNDAEHVTLFCGRGCADAHAALMSLAETLKSPIVHALGGKEYVEYDNPYDVGMTGFIGFASGYQAMHECNVLLMLGTDFPYKQFLPTTAKIVQVDIRAENLGRRCKLDLGLVGDIGATIEALLPRLSPKSDRLHLDDSVARYREMKLPVKVVIFNNGVLGFVALEMKAAGFVELGTDLKNPDFAAMSRAMGILGVRVEDPGELPSAVTEVLNHDGPAVLDVVTATQELSMPPTIGAEQMKGFSLWLLRAVMSGRGDEVIGLAKQNLLPR